MQRDYVPMERGMIAITQLVLHSKLLRRVAKEATRYEVLRSVLDGIISQKRLGPAVFPPGHSCMGRDHHPPPDSAFQPQTHLPGHNLFSVKGKREKGETSGLSGNRCLRTCCPGSCRSCGKRTGSSSRRRRCRRFSNYRPDRHDSRLCNQTENCCQGKI